MWYKNMNRFAKTFHGVEFKPGSTHEVQGYINDPGFIHTSPKKSKAASTVAAKNPARVETPKAETPKGDTK